MNTQIHILQCSEYDSNGDCWDNAFEDHLIEEQEVDEKFNEDE